MSPSAWSSSPPETPPPPPPPFIAVPQPSQPMQSIPLSTPAVPQSASLSTVPHHAMSYVVWKHQNAMQALNNGRVVVCKPGDPTSLILETSRPWAVQILERNGYSWPAILEEPYPGVDDDGMALDSLPEGAKYELVTSATE